MARTVDRTTVRFQGGTLRRLQSLSAVLRLSKNQLIELAVTDFCDRCMSAVEPSESEESQESTT
jgi:predicted transcriptional regulator